MDIYMNKQEVLNWLRVEIEEATGIKGQLDAQCASEDYCDLENNIARHEQDGWLNAMEYVQAIVKAQA
jgi:hypothetical protein